MHRNGVSCIMRSNNGEGRILTGQIRYVDFSQGDVALQGGVRPAVIVQNNAGCNFSPRIWVVPLTCKVDKANHLPVHIRIPKSDDNGLKRDSMALVEQTQFVLKDKIGDFIGYLETENATKLGNAWINNCCGMFPSQVLAPA